MSITEKVQQLIALQLVTNARVRMAIMPNLETARIGKPTKQLVAYNCAQAYASRQN